MTDEQLTEYAYELSNRFEKVNVEYLESVGKHIKEIENTKKEDISIIRNAIIVSAASNKIRKKLSLVAGSTMKDVEKLYNHLAKDIENTYSNWYVQKNGVLAIRTRLQANKAMRNFVQKSVEETSAVFSNIARTTAIDKQYRNLVDKAVAAVVSGEKDYKSVIRKTLKETGLGLKVEYASGVTRRLDSAFRMNMLDGVRNVNNGLREIAGQEFGADGVEVSAHALCAEDHLDIQGEQFTLSDFDRENNMLAREIGTCNCKHYTIPIILGISQPAYSKEQLDELKDLSREEVTIGNRTKTRYEWSQECRRLETEMRKTKTTHILARSSGDEVLRKECNKQLRKLQGHYRQVCNDARLTKHYDRAYVPGFRNK